MSNTKEIPGFWDKPISRRSFLNAAFLGGSGLAALTIAGCDDKKSSKMSRFQENSPTKTSPEETWNMLKTAIFEISYPRDWTEPLINDSRKDKVIRLQPAPTDYNPNIIIKASKKNPQENNDDDESNKISELEAEIGGNLVGHAKAIYPSREIGNQSSLLIEYTVRWLDGIYDHRRYIFSAKGISWFIDIGAEQSNLPEFDELIDHMLDSFEIRP